MRFLLLASFFLSGCSTAGYLAHTSLGQWRLFNKARPIAEVLASPHTTEKERHGIEMVGKAKAFAVELGLKATRNYETYARLDAPCVSWAVSASHPLRLEEKKWTFPIVGSVPYLGFFDKASAEAEARKLEANEDPRPDTWVRCVPAFSSLGWFADPLYSSMISGKDHHIVELIVHESLHATVWVSGSVDFNEKLANFVGLEGSVRYMERTQGAKGAELVREEVRGEKVFADFMHEAVARYKKAVSSAADKEKFYAGLAAAYSEFVAARQKGGQKFTPMPRKLEGWNNAALLAYSNYYSDYSVLEKLLSKCGGDLGRFVGWIARTYEKDESHFEEAPEAYLAKMADGERCE